MVHGIYYTKWTHNKKNLNSAVQFIHVPVFYHCGAISVIVVSRPLSGYYEWMLLSTNAIGQQVYQKFSCVVVAYMHR